MWPDQFNGISTSTRLQRMNLEPKFCNMSCLIIWLYPFKEPGREGVPYKGLELLVLAW